MEEKQKLPLEQPAQQTVPATPKEKPAHRAIGNKKLFLAFGIIFVLLVIGGSGFFFGVQTTLNNLPTPTPTNTPTPTVTNTPTPTIVVPTDTGIPIGANTVSFTRVDGKLYLRYKGHLYSQEAANKNDYTLTQLPNPDAYQWYGLVDAPQIPADALAFDEVFDFKLLPNKYDFIFIMRWPTNATTIDYRVFYYDSYKEGNKVTNFFNTSVNPDTKGYQIPRLYEITSDGKYIAFNMFSCWNCGGHQPEVLLFDRETKETKNIGKVSYFKWRTKSDYEYKEYKVIECKFEGPGECSIEPDKLPFITGTF